MERKLATIRKIADLRPIEGADLIELAIIDGWQSVVKKGEFNVGDQIVYCEIDSWIPHTIAPFLSKGAVPKEYNGIPGAKLKTIKLRGQISQGLILSVASCIEQSGCWIPLVEALVEGEDASEWLNIQKWEPVATGMGETKGSFPDFIPKTDQERVQNITGYLIDDAIGFPHRIQYEVTTKLEGRSITIYYHNGSIGVCSRNQELVIDGNVAGSCYVKTAIDSKIFDALRKHCYNKQISPDYQDGEQPYCVNVAIQGELMGPGVEGNHEGLDRLKIFIYDVYNIDTMDYLLPQARRHFVEALLQHCDQNIIEHIPVLHNDFPLSSLCGEMPNRDIVLEKAFELADGPSLRHTIREGVVLKQTKWYDRGTKQPLSWKIINNNYLLTVSK